MAKNHRWSALAAAFLWVIFALAGSISKVAGAAADLDDTARLISGAHVGAPRAGGATEGPWRSYAQEVSNYWREYDRRIGRPLRQWACNELGRAEGATVFYPFSGPDLPWAYQLFPEADRYVLVAMEKAEAPPLMEDFSREEQEGYVAAFRAAWKLYGALGFFRTNDLIAETTARGTRLGATGPLLAFAARLGFEIESIEPIELDLNTSDLVLRDPGATKDDTWDSVRLTLRKGGRKVRVDYVRMDLSDASLGKVPGARRWIERMASNPTVLKAASHHPQEPAFSMFSNSVVANAPIVVQDETGIDYASMTPDYTVRLYGKFTKPNNAFDPGLQRPLAAAYRTGAGVKPLPFRLGYEKDSGSSLQVATRNASGNAGDPARNCGPS